MRAAFCKDGEFIHNKFIHYAGNPYWLDTNNIKKKITPILSLTSDKYLSHWSISFQTNAYLHFSIFF